MGNDKGSPYSAAPQFLGYDYQSRYALYYLLSTDEENELLIEAGDDLEISQEGSKLLASLKHRAEGNTLTDLSMDFWQSVNIWLEAYKNAEKAERSLVFFLMTTSCVSEDSFLLNLTADRKKLEGIVDLANTAISNTKNEKLIKIREKYDKMSHNEKQDFLSRITIFNNSIRIEDIAEKIKKKFFKAILPEHRQPVWERLWGWWDGQVIELLTGTRVQPISEYEVNVKLSSINSTINEQDLPIDFLDANLTDDQFKAFENMLFVKQLEEIKVSTKAIRNAILNYYRAFRQRSVWLRRDFLINDDDLKKWEKQLEEEWDLFMELEKSNLPDDASEKQMIEVGRKIYTWTQLETDYLQLRDRVSAPYVRRGYFHMLANKKPIPRVYWHPLFLERVEKILKG